MVGTACKRCALKRHALTRRRWPDSAVHLSVSGDRIIVATHHQPRRTGHQFVPLLELREIDPESVLHGDDEFSQVTA